MPKLNLTTAYWRRMLIEVFSTTTRALAHICDHVLTRPETWLWTLYIPDHSRLMDPMRRFADLERRQEFAMKLWLNPTPSQAQQLYDNYADEIKRSLGEAENRQWFWEEEEINGYNRRFYGFGLSGLKVSGTPMRINTAFFPFFSSGEEYKQELDVARRQQKPLPREPEGANGPRWAPPDTLMARYEIFYKCALAVRRKYFDACKNRDLRVTLEPNWDDFVEKGPPTLSVWLQYWKKSDRSKNGETIG